MTFFPRRFHPFAVRPYTERAVPELQDHIRHCLDHEGRPVVVAAHSQGTVIAFAALAGLDDDHLSRVALVTYGSPLSRLFGRFFPAYFSPSDFERLAGRLFDDGRDPPAGWRSFYRRTDQIGQRVFDQVPAEAGRDEEVPDPAEAETPDDVPPFLEPDVAPWAAISGHNAYPRERAVKRWVAAVAARMDDRSG
jgi:hypothetical protein